MALCCHPGARSAMFHVCQLLPCLLRVVALTACLRVVALTACLRVLALTACLRVVSLTACLRPLSPKQPPPLREPAVAPLPRRHLQPWTPPWERPRFRQRGSRETQAVAPRLLAALQLTRLLRRRIWRRRPWGTCCPSWRCWPTPTCCSAHPRYTPAACMRSTHPARQLHLLPLPSWAPGCRADSLDSGALYARVEVHRRACCHSQGPCSSALSSGGQPAAQAAGADNCVADLFAFPPHIRSKV